MSQPRRLPERAGHRARKPCRADRSFDLGGDPNAADLPLLIVRAAYGGGYPTTASLTTMACLSRDWRALVDETLGVAVERLSTLYSLLWAATRAHRTHRSDPQLSGARRAAIQDGLWQEAMACARRFEARLARVVGNNTADLCAKYIKRRLGLDGYVHHDQFNTFAFPITRPLLAAMLLRQCQACCGRDASHAALHAIRGARSRRCYVDTEAKAVGEAVFFPAACSHHLFGHDACWQRISVPLELPVAVMNPNPLEWVGLPSRARLHGDGELERGHVALGMLRQAGLPDPSSPAARDALRLQHLRVGRLCLDRHDYLPPNLTLAGRLGLGRLDVLKAQGEARQVTRLVKLEEEAVREARRKHMLACVDEWLGSNTLIHFSRAGPAAEARAVERPADRETSLQELERLHLPGFTATLERLHALHDVAAPANAGSQSNVTKARVTWLGGGSRSRHINPAVDLPPIRELLQRVRLLFEHIQPNDRELAARDPWPTLASGHAYAWLAGTFAASLPGPTTGWRAVTEQASRRDGLMWRHTLDSPAPAPLPRHGRAGGGVVGGASQFLTSSADGPELNALVPRLVAAARLFDAIGTSSCKLLVTDMSEEKAAIELRWSFRLPAFREIGLVMAPSGRVPNRPYAEVELLHAAVLAALEHAPFPGSDALRQLHAKPPSRVVWTKAMSHWPSLMPTSKVPKETQAKAKAKAEVVAYLGAVATALMARPQLRAAGMFVLGIFPITLAEALGSCAAGWQKHTIGVGPPSLQGRPPARLVVRGIKATEATIRNVARNTMRLCGERPDLATPFTDGMAEVGLGAASADAEAELEGSDSGELEEEDGWV